MKIKTVKTTYREVQARPRPPHRRPRVRSLFWHTLVRLIIIPDLLATRFKLRRAGKMPDEPCLVLMNQSSFLDLKIAFRLLYPRRFSVVATTDAMMGKAALMRWLGCIPTQKFVTDLSLVRDMNYCFKTLKSSVLMYPEAGYSFDGTATTLPRKMGVLLKKFDVPVVMIETEGIFARNPLYNELQIRKDVNLSAKAYVLFTQEEVRSKTVQELSDGIDNAFGFDHFKWQKEQGLLIEEPFRADGLHRILYKCASCGAEGEMEGRGTKLTCRACGKQHELMPLGHLEAVKGETDISHIPDWYRWEREQVRQDIIDGRYKLDTDVTIAMQVDYKAIYMVGEGHLTHDNSGFHLTGCDGKLDYSQKPQSCFGLYADYYWYEIDDCICIGDSDVHYFCFPKDKRVSVAKLRLATEEMYKLYKSRVLHEKL